MDTATPLHFRIQAALRSALEGGEYAPDRPLPGEHALARRFGAARMTVRRALAALEQDGLIRREPGRGTWPTARAVAPTLGGLHADIRRFVAASAVRVLSCDVVPALPAAAGALGIAEGLPTLRLVRVRHDGQGPFSHVTSWVPSRLLGPEDAMAMGSGTIMDALAERGYIAAGAEQLISAAAADPGIAQALDIQPGAALTRLDRIVRDGRGTAIEFSRWLYRPDRFAYAVTLGAGAGAEPPRWVARAAEVAA